MNKNSLLRYMALSAKLIALFSLQVITIFEAHALSCIPLFHNSDEVRERLGRADIVVLGKIERVGKPFFSGWGESVSADVMVEQTFKGASAVTVEVLVKSTILPGQLVVLFARRESADQASQRARSVLEKSKSSATAREASSKPLLQADGQCDWALTLADTPEGKLDLQHLRTLPPVGSGGSMKLQISANADSRWEGGYGTGVAKLSLTLFGDNKKYVGVTNDQGDAVFANLPAGRYAAKLPAVSGFTVNCTGPATADCNSFVVTDRGLHRYAVRYDPDASVEVALVDADDQIVKAMASFRLTRLDALGTEQTANAVFAKPKSIQFANKVMSSSRSGHDQHVAVPPGKYLLELLLSDIRAQTPSKANKFSRHRVVSARSITTLHTSSIDLRSGDNKIVFKLSRDLTPNTLSYSAHASQHPSARELYFSEWLLDVDGKNGTSFINNFNSHSAYEKSRQVIVIPGQSWEVSATDYSKGYNEVIEGRAVVHINGDKNIVLDVSTKRKY